MEKQKFLNESRNSVENVLFSNKSLKSFKKSSKYLPKSFFFSLLVSLSQNQGFVFIKSICIEQFNILHILQYLFKINFEIFLHYFFAAIETFNYINLERH